LNNVADSAFADVQSVSYQAVRIACVNHVQDFWSETIGFDSLPWLSAYLFTSGFGSRYARFNALPYEVALKFSQGRHDTGHQLPLRCA
jgi:hypothetical protein